ncbi:MAG: aminodeoxychorismate synthase, component I [Deltaproteobacteria bacterium GWA2_54_12]|nr:MAG: aminodeoxychorismate synthase, component I [Deltaproteobacteria bacterium GWA2_54_12]
MRIEPIQGVTPQAAFLALRKLGRPFLFSGSAATGRRYSYAGAGPLSTMGMDKVADPFEALSKALTESKAGKGPFPFLTGAVAYFSYDLKGLIEPGLSFKKKDGPDIPLFMAGLYDPVFVYDHEERKGYLASRSAAAERIAAFMKLLESAPSFAAASIPKAKRFSSDTSKEEYISKVIKAKEYIASGDIYQINLSHRLSIQWAGDPFALYMKLLETHPAPLSSYLDFGSFQIISNSPEVLLRVEDDIAETCPIKGTRRRGHDSKEDNALVEELRASRKERAEHVMIVDLERSDLGKVCLPGSVEVSSFEEVVTYPHLHHMVSTIKGKLTTSIDAPMALKALFPGGSITGAPKVRAMQIIDEIENSARSIYTGGIGWFDQSGWAEISVAIRTAVYKDGRLSLSVGGGIVADSVPEDEYDETILKAQDFLRALGVA